MIKSVKGKINNENKIYYYKTAYENTDGIFSCRSKSLVVYYSKFKYIPNLFKSKIILLSCDIFKFLHLEINEIESNNNFMTPSEYNDLYDREVLNLTQEEIKFIAEFKILKKLNPTEFIY